MPVILILRRSVRKMVAKLIREVGTIDFHGIVGTHMSQDTLSGVAALEVLEYMDF